MQHVERTTRGRLVLALLAFALAAPRVDADVATPPWFDRAWHYRVPITIPGGAQPGSTILVDVDFTALLAQLGIAAGADFDEASPRVVRPNGTPASRQEFTDRVFGLVLDAANNGRGEVRFLLQDTAAAGTYWLYFDIAANGAKPANPATPINGNFEQSAGAVPTGWVTSAVNTNGAQQNLVFRTTLGSTTTVPGGCQSSTQSVSTSPNAVGAVATGEAWHLLGYRNACEDGSGNELVRLSRDIAVPSGAAAGTLTFHFQVQGWDGIENGTNYDWVVFYVNGSAVNHRNLGIDNSTSPALVIDNNRLGRNGYSSTYRDHGWKRATINLAPYAGTTINFRIETRHSSADNDYRSWVRIDDVSWSVQTASLGPPQGFGVNVVLPNDTAAGPPSLLTGSQPVAIRAVVDAIATAVTADVYDDGGTLVASGRALFDDGSHGDAVANDGIWTNDGTVPGEGTYTIAPTDPAGSGWRVRVYARDASPSVAGAAANGLLRRPGQPPPLVEANYFNIDSEVFEVGFTRMRVEKAVATDRDPVNGATDPKALPGAWVQYRLTVTNEGPGPIDVDTVQVVEALDASIALCVSTTCAAGGPVTFDESASPAPTGLTFDYASHVRFSVDGVSFDYTPDPDAEGFDAAITHLRVVPAGAMSAPTAAGQPSFVLRYVGRVD